MKILCTSSRRKSEVALSQRSLQKRGKNRYRILYSDVYTGPDADVNEMFDQFQAEISVSNPYDDANYAWASIHDGKIEIVSDGKVIRKTFYFNADDEDVENEEWCDAVINRALDELESFNSKVESRIIHNSTEMYSRMKRIMSHGLVQNSVSSSRDLRYSKSKQEVTASDKSIESQLINNMKNDHVDIRDIDEVTSYLETQFGYTHRESLELYTRINETNTGYWFFTRHGVQPGSVPKDVEILDMIDTREGTFVKFDRFLSTKELNYYDMIEKAPEGITSAEDVQDEDVYDDIKEIGQEFTSENTSINSKKLPAVFNMVKFNPGTVNLDYGGGKADTAVEYLEQYDVVNLVYDPYNRSSDHNREVIQLIREHGGADTATCSNVLNVIKEPEVRQNVLNNISKLVKPGGIVYITVYEGKGTNEGAPTKSGYQLNRKTSDYMEEIQEVFPECKRRGKLIECINSGSITSSIYDEDDDTSWILLEHKSVLDSDGFYTDYCLYQNPDGSEYVCIFGDKDLYIPENKEPDAEFDSYEEAKEWFDSYEGFVDDDDIYSSKSEQVIAQLKQELETAVREVMTSEEFGFYDNEVKQYSAVDVYTKDENIVCEIRAEVSFDGLMDLCNRCNKVVEKYYKDAYFDPEEPGIATAYIPTEELNITGAVTAMEDSMLEPPEPKEYDEVTEEFEIEVDLSGVVIRIEDDSWEYEDETYSFAQNDNGEDYRSEYGVYVDDTTGVVEKIDELIEKDIPIGTGRYKLSGYAHIVYDISGIESDKDYYPDGDYDEEIYTDNAKAEFNFEKSSIQDLEITRL